MEGRAKALVLWVQQATESPPIGSINQVRNCQLLERLLSQIEGFYFAGSTGSSEWKQYYNRLRSVYEQVDTYLKETLKVVVPTSLSTINLVEMAKGESEEGLESILLLVFVTCVRCPISESFVTCILRLPSDAQSELMRILQDYQTDVADQKEDDSQLNYYKQQLAAYKFQHQNLMQENISLRASLEEYDERAIKSQQLVSKLQAQNEQLVMDLSEKSEQLRLREQNFLDKYAQHNEDIVQDLKKKLLDQEHAYSSEILRLKETVYSLQGQLGEAKRQSSDLLELQERRSLLQSRDDHINCIAIEKHKMKINEMLAINKQATKKEVDFKLEIIKLNNKAAEMESTIKKQSEEIRKKDSDFMINTEDASKLKIELFTRVRDSLKKKLLDYKSKQNHDGSGDKIDFLDDE